jgi:hypothetical protein
MRAPGRERGAERISHDEPEDGSGPALAELLHRRMLAAGTARTRKKHRRRSQRSILW